MDFSGDEESLDPYFIRYLNFIKEKKQRMMSSPSIHVANFLETEIKTEPLEGEGSEEYSDYSSDNVKYEDSEGSSGFTMYPVKEEPVDMHIKKEISEEESEEEEGDYCMKEAFDLNKHIKEEMAFEENEIASSCGYESDFSTNGGDGPINLSLKKWEESSSSDVDGSEITIEQEYINLLRATGEAPQNLLDVGIPMTVDDIVHLPLTAFRDRLSKCNLTPAQIRILKDLRRKGKNRMYSQNSRKKRTNHIMQLKHELRMVRACKTRLFLERQCIVAEREALERKFMQLYYLIFKTCTLKDVTSCQSDFSQFARIMDYDSSSLFDQSFNIDPDEEDKNSGSPDASHTDKQHSKSHNDQTVPASVHNSKDDSMGENISSGKSSSGEQESSLEADDEKSHCSSNGQIKKHQHILANETNENFGNKNINREKCSVEKDAFSSQLDSLSNNNKNSVKNEDIQGACGTKGDAIDLCVSNSEDTSAEDTAKVDQLEITNHDTDSSIVEDEITTVRRVEELSSSSAVKNTNSENKKDVFPDKSEECSDATSQPS